MFKKTAFLVVLLVGFVFDTSCKRKPPIPKVPNLTPVKIDKDRVEPSMQINRFKNGYRLWVCTKPVANGETPWWPRWGEPRVY